MTRYRLDLSYDGTDFLGSQRQPQGKTVQSELEKALGIVFKEPIQSVFSGRTDAGVHALHQVVHFDAPFSVPNSGLRHALNSILSSKIDISQALQVSSDFHARFSAQSRTYYYYFSDMTIPVFFRKYITMTPFLINLEKLKGLESVFVGQKDFQAFGSTGSNQKSSIRTITDISVSKLHSHPYFMDTDFPVYRLSITANGFLYHMVRNIMGALFEVVRGYCELDDLKAMIENNKKIHYTTAKPYGLYLALITY